MAAHHVGGREVQVVGHLGQILAVVMHRNLDELSLCRARHRPALPGTQELDQPGTGAHLGPEAHEQRARGRHQLLDPFDRVAAQRIQQRQHVRQVIELDEHDMGLYRQKTQRNTPDGNTDTGAGPRLDLDGLRRDRPHRAHR